MGSWALVEAENPVLTSMAFLPLIPEHVLAFMHSSLENFDVHPYVFRAMHYFHQIIF